MPTILSHPAVPLAMGLAAGRSLATPALIALGAFASIAPDFDVALLRLGIPYASEFGHRGASHSLAFSVMLAGVLGFAYARFFSRPFVFAMLFILLAGVSHPLLDMCTDGGHGVALFWPLSNERYFFDFRPITVSPLGLQRFFSSVGLNVLRTEAIWIWAPALTLAAVVQIVRRRLRAPTPLP